MSRVSFEPELSDYGVQLLNHSAVRKMLVIKKVKLYYFNIDMR